jgi:hypothetical protein
VGYVRLAQFGAKASDELEEAVKKVGFNKGLIVDLRNNPGGRVQAALEVAQLFLRKETLVFRTDGRKSDADQEYRAKRTGPFLDAPVILLVDGGTASAAEALAVALQDHRRARLVGRRTFGKALVQAPFFLKTGDVIWMTIARVFSPNGRLIQQDYTALSPEAYYAMAHADSSKGGVMPDLHVQSITYPTWWTRALASGITYTVADSVAATLPNTPAARNAWLSTPEDWQRQLLPPLFARLQQSAPRADENLKPDVRAAISRMLAIRAAEVRWGLDAALELMLASDPDVRAAQALLRSP